MRSVSLTWCGGFGILCDNRGSVAGNMSLTVHQGEILHCLDDPLEHEDAWEYFKDGILALEDGRIVACGHSGRLADRFQNADCWTRHENGLLVPGMVDTHIHYPQTEVIASHGRRLIDWLETYTFPAELKFSDPARASEAAGFFIRELLRNGTTSALVFGTVHAQSAEAFFEAAYARNLRMICGKVLMDRNAPADLCDTPETGYLESAELIRRWHGRGRLGYAVTPRFALTSSPDQLQQAGRLLDDYRDVHLHTHLAENPEECDRAARLFPDCRDYLDVYDRYGLLGRRSVFAHGIHLSDREWGRMRETGSSIAHCPTSNLFIGSGLFPLGDADRHGVRVGLGTDVGGGDSFSMFRTANEAYKVQQLRNNVVSPLRLFYLATLGGARVLDLDGCIGNFEPGKEGDFIVLDYAATPLIARRVACASTIMETLFALQMLGDDRLVRQTWIMGERQYPD